MPVTQGDIAKRLNVSKATVAKALSNSTNVWLSNETRRRVKAAAKEMGYRPRQAAISLRTGRTCMIALIYVNRDKIPKLPGQAVTDIAETIGLSEYNLIARHLVGSKNAREAVVRMVESEVCDGIILWGEDDLAEEIGVMLTGMQFPFVVKGRFEQNHPDWAQVDFDHEAMMERSVSELWERGHRRIGFLGDDNEFAYATHLLRGFRESMARRSATIDDQLIAKVSCFWDESCAAVERWLDLPEAFRPTSVVIASTPFAWKGTEIALARQGRRIGCEPDDFAAIGIITQPKALFAGNGLCFEITELGTLGRELGNAVIALVKNEQPKSPVVRLMPPLVPTIQLDIEYPMEVARGLQLFCAHN